MNLLALMLPLLLAGAPQERPAEKPAGDKPDKGVEKDKKDNSDKEKADKDKKPEPEEKPVVTRHEVKIGAQVLKYSVTTGLLPIKNEVGETEANIFFMAYVADRTGGPDRRPLMFSFNGGPGSSSVWLHLGALGPKRVKMQEDGMMPSPPYKLVDNEHTWLDQTDLVFIDPVGTGYSRAAKPELGKKFWGLQGDLDSVGEFIRLYLTRYERWGSPLFLVGESYGT
ncbi:MAG TPA: peptidase S10, partial [Vicinamibacteria bacterium]